MDPKTPEPKTTDTKIDNPKDDPAVAAAKPVAPSLMDQLDGIDRRARAAGHSLAEILAVAAKNQFGIDVREPPPAPVED